MESRPKRRHGNVWADSSKDRGRRKEAVGRISFHLQVRIRQFRFATVFRVKKGQAQRLRFAFNTSVAASSSSARLQYAPQNSQTERPSPSCHVERSRNISNCRTEWIDCYFGEQRDQFGSR